MFKGSPLSIKRFELFQGPLRKFTRPLPLKTRWISGRPSWFLKAYGRSEEMISEVVWAQGWGPISYEDLMRGVSLIPELHCSSWEEYLSKKLPEKSIPGPVLHALDSLLFHYFFDQRPLEIPLAQLGISEKILPNSSVKLKIHPNNKEEVIKQIIKLQGQKTKVRLDANHTLSLGEIFQLLKGIAPEIIEFIEDPAPPSIPKNQRGQFPVKVARDEGDLLNADTQFYDLAVVKFSQWGYHQLERIFHRFQGELVASCLYEGPENLSYLGHLAKKFAGHYPAGFFPLLAIEDNLPRVSQSSHGGWPSLVIYPRPSKDQALQ